MSDGVDTSELRRLDIDLTAAGVRTLVGVRGIVQKGALNIKKTLQAEAAGVAHAPGLPRTITYETSESSSAVTAEIGPEKGNAGSLALLYFGNPRTGPRLKDPRFALEREMTEVVRRLGDLGEHVL